MNTTENSEDYYYSDYLAYYEQGYDSLRYFDYYDSFYDEIYTLAKNMKKEVEEMTQTEIPKQGYCMLIKVAADYILEGNTDMATYITETVENGFNSRHLLYTRLL